MMNWPQIFNSLCTREMGMGGIGRDPNDIAHWTLDQLYMVISKRRDLLPRGKVRMTPDQAMAKGLMGPPNPEGSLVQQIKEGKIEAPEHLKGAYVYDWDEKTPEKP